MSGNVTRLTGQYGSKENPYVEFPFDLVVRISGTYAVLTATVLATKYGEAGGEFFLDLQSFPVLTPVDSINLGPYAPGDAIAWTDETWKGHSVANVTFHDQAPIEVLDQLPDKPPAPVGPPSYEVCLDAGPTPSGDGIPGDGSGAAYYNEILRSHSTATTQVAAIVARMAGSGGTLSSLFDITGILAANAASGSGIGVTDSSPPLPTNCAGDVYPPVPVQYMIGYWSGIPFPPPPTPGASGTTATAYVQYNAYSDATSTVWHVLTLSGPSLPFPGDALVTVRLVLLIDLAHVHADGYKEVVVSQSWLPLDPEFTDPGYHNTYRLQIYSAPNFIAGPAQTVTVPTKPGPPGQPPVPVAVPSYDVTKTVLWNDGAEASHQVLHFDTTGWLK
jgi:hypothetical protein